MPFVTKSTDELRADWLRAVVGQPEDGVRFVVQAGGGRFRVVSRNGVRAFGTADMDPDRLNVELREGKVVRAYFG